MRPNLRTAALCAVFLALYWTCIALAWPHAERGVHGMIEANRVVEAMWRE